MKSKTNRYKFLQLIIGRIRSSPLLPDVLRALSYQVPAQPQIQKDSVCTVRHGEPRDAEREGEREMERGGHAGRRTEPCDLYMARF